MRRRASRAFSIDFEGGFDQSDIAVLIVCLDTSGGREIEAADRLKVTGLEIRDVIVLSDREGGAREWANTSPDPLCPRAVPPAALQSYV
jgi:orotate phosphoribosyltransferase